jgi:surface antigen
LKAFSYSQALLALAILFLAYALLQVTANIPLIVKSIDKASNTIDKTAITIDKISPEIPRALAQAEKIRAEVALVRLMLDKQIPDILEQIETSKPLLDAAIKESERYSSQIPKVTQQIALVQADIDQFTKLVPDILNRIDNIVNMANTTQAEVEKWRPISERYLVQIQQSQFDIPQYLLRVENIVIDAKTIGEEASSGIVSGFFKGVVSLPFNMVSNVSGVINEDTASAKYLTATDLDIMKTQIGVLLQGESNKVIWHNKESGNRGTVTKVSQENKGDRQCYKIILNNAFKNKKETLTELMCENKAGQWEVM